MSVSRSQRMQRGAMLFGDRSREFTYSYSHSEASVKLVNVFSQYDSQDAVNQSDCEI